MQGDPDRPATRSPKDFWEGSFGRYTGQVKESEGDKEKKDSLRDQTKEFCNPYFAVFGRDLCTVLFALPSLDH